MASGHREDLSFREKMGYYVDLFMSRSSTARLLILFALSFILISICAALFLFVSPELGGQKPDFGEAMWWSMIRVLDSGGLAADQDAMVRMVGFLATLSGILVVAMLISLMSTAVRDRIEDLRKGKSPVIDSNHTLILGFGDKIYPILRELREANKSRRKATIVILSSLDKQLVETMVNDKMGSMLNTRVVVRSGLPFSPKDLIKVGAGRARSIIILSSYLSVNNSVNDPDLNAIKAILALRRVPGALERNYAVVELEDSKRAALIAQLGGRGVELVSMRETLARIIVQTSLQSGLASVYREILDFGGSELYIKEFANLAGRPFSGVQELLKGGIALGIRRPSQGDFEVVINPDPATVLGLGDELIVLAEDEDTFKVDLEARKSGTEIMPPKRQQETLQPQRILIVGLRSDFDRILCDFDEYVPRGSEVIFMPGEHLDLDILSQHNFKNLSLKIIPGNPTDLDDVKAAVSNAFDSVLLLADNRLSMDESDARVVISLLLLRDIMNKFQPARRPKMTSEILNPNTKDLVTTDETTDFVASSEITSMILAQVSEQRDLNRIYMDLFSPSGSEIYLKSIERYLATDTLVAWSQIQKSAQNYKEIAIGCFRPGMAPLIHPADDVIMTFKAGDKLIVLADNGSETAIDTKAAA
jgi:hypothetical protein